MAKQGVQKKVALQEIVKAKPLAPQSVHNTVEIVPQYKQAMKNLVSDDLAAPAAPNAPDAPNAPNCNDPH